MIALDLPARFERPDDDPFVARLGAGQTGCADLVATFADRLVFQHQGAAFAVARPGADEALGDVVFADPAAGRLSRWLRQDSPHNTLLVTERCDQLCVMCSQPPRKSHVDRFGYFLEACRLAPADMTIGLSGGEPTLYLPQLIRLIEQIGAERPDLRFHILTNAQHFSAKYLPALRGAAFDNVLWGVPIYAAEPDLHDGIVGKSGAFDQLTAGLSLLARAGQAVELRTVVVKSNYTALPALARWVAAHASFVTVWALMQLEAAGFARARWRELFIDHSADPAPLAEAVSLATALGIETALYNMPHCATPAPLRPFLRPSISDWKRAFPPACAPCRARSACSGFFAWRVELSDYREARPL